ncbi:lipase 3-like [Aricia agestis]|uniref:lipase 3-like n=1 Tax=Aricia agestis TaxID=91739 RepID=UPI001C20795A|nr:lipase 3-like [Aricia agestis]
MRAAVVVLCLAIAQLSSARVLRTHWPHIDTFTLEEQAKIHQYERDIQQILAEKTKDSSSVSHETSSKHSSSESHEHKQSSEDLITLQTLTTSHETKDQERIFNEALTIMRHVSEEDKKKIQEAFAAAKKDAETKNATEMIQEHGYAFEKHEVKTADGYFITLFRILPKKDIREVGQRPVALLVHGLLGSADDWLLMGPGKSLAYQMVDAGLDVWLGNVRGSRYSRRHAAKHPAQPDFWQFAVDEIAAHDLPAMIDYTLEHTQQEKLFYVGHSLGATAFLAMASTHPEYKDKVAMMYALAPMVYMTYVRSPLLRMLAPTSRYYEAVTHKLGRGEFAPEMDFIRRIGGEMTEDVIGSERVSSNLKFVVSGVDTAGMDWEMMPIIAKHLPAGASTRQIKQFGQAKAAGQLRKYDYGSEVNMKVYGQQEPPKYNMTDVQVPVAIYYSEEDLLAHPTDVERLHSELPDVRDFYKVPEQHFSHMDFQFAKTTPVTINQRLIDSIKQMYV